MSETIVCNGAEILPASRRLLNEPHGQEFLALLSPAGNPAELARLLADPALALPGAPPYLADLARLELALYLTGLESAALPPSVARPTVNSTLQLFESSWTGLPQLLEENGADAVWEPCRRQEMILV